MSDGRPHSRWILAPLTGAWLAAVAAGMGILIRYSAISGDVGMPPPSWPSETSIARTARRPILILMAHPRCPCTRATMEELARLMRRMSGRIEARVVFYAPAGVAEDWWKSDIWTSAAAIPGVTAILDTDAVEARRFHVETSGHALLYDASGRLLFSGGITMARGHAGDNAGEDWVEAVMRGDPSIAKTTSVFGCRLRSARTIPPALEE